MCQDSANASVGSTRTPSFRIVLTLTPANDCGKTYSMWKLTSRTSRPPSDSSAVVYSGSCAWSGNQRRYEMMASSDMMTMTSRFGVSLRMYAGSTVISMASATRLTHSADIVPTTCANATRPSSKNAE